VKSNDNLTIETPHVRHSSRMARWKAIIIPPTRSTNLSKAGKPLLVRLRPRRREEGADQGPRWPSAPPTSGANRELFAGAENHPTSSALGEIMTPLIRLPKLAKKLGGGEIIVKDEGRLPTGSFKARGLVMAVSMGKALGNQAHGDGRPMAMRGAALAAYATSCGIKTTIFLSGRYAGSECQRDRAAGARPVYRVNGLIDDCGKIVGEGKAKGRLVRYLDPEGGPIASRARRRWAWSLPSSSAGKCPM